MTPDEQGIFYVLVVGGGPGSGEFVYDAAGNLRSSNVGQVTTDPVQGISCPQGFATFNGLGAVINLLSTSKGAFFQYRDLGTAVQGSLILSVASTASTDPVLGTAYSAGLTGTDPAFGDFLNATGAVINMGVAGALTQNGRIQVNQAPSNAQNPFIVLYAPEQGTSGHLVMVMQGASPDGTRGGQILIATQATGFTNPSPVSKAMLELQGNAVNTPTELIQAAAAADSAFAVKTAGDAANRFQVNGSGQHGFGGGAAGVDSFLSWQAANILQVTAADLDIATAGKGLRVKEGANARMGRSVLAGGTVVVANTSVTAATEIFLCCQIPGGTPGFLRVSARTAGTSFTILSSSATDTSTVAWFMMEPG